MTTMTTPFVLTTRPTTARAQAIRRIVRRLTEAWNASVNMTAQDRADAYVARMPVAVIAG